MSQQFTDGVVTLTPPRDEDAEAVAAAVQASLDTLMPWLPWASADYDAESAREWIRHAADPCSRSLMKNTRPTGRNCGDASCAS